MSLNIVNRFSYDIRIRLNNSELPHNMTDDVFIQIDVNFQKCLPTINQDVIYNSSQSSPNLDHPDICTCFLYLLLFYLVLTTILFRFCARFLKIFEGQNRKNSRDTAPLIYGYTRKNAQVVTGLQTSCYKSVHKLCSHCLFPVVVTSLEQAVNNL
jgi:hypothetical protein